MIVTPSIWKSLRICMPRKQLDEYVENNDRYNFIKEFLHGLTLQDSSSVMVALYMLAHGGNSHIVSIIHPSSPFPKEALITLKQLSKLKKQKKDLMAAIAANSQFIDELHEFQIIPCSCVMEMKRASNAKQYFVENFLYRMGVERMHKLICVCSTLKQDAAVNILRSIFTRYSPKYYFVNRSCCS